jgi:uncharacterized protein with von Willebrand factor type A (vWA) domain
MQSSLLRFIEVLRSHSLPVSPAETLDAAAAMELVGYGNRSALADALATTLAKSQREEETFHACFNRFFDQQTSNFHTGAGSDNDGEGGPTEAHESTNSAEQARAQEDGSAGSGASSDGQRLAEAAAQSPALQALLSGELMPALLENQRATLSAALRRAAADVQLERIRMFTQKGQYTRRILDALGEGQLRDAVIELERSDSPALETLRRYRDVLREQVRDFVQKEYLLHAEGRNDAFMDDILSKTRLSNIDRRHVDRVRLQVRRMARKLASRHSSRRRQVKRGQLNMGRTMRAGIAHDGVLFRTHWRNRKRDKAQVMALCDVSGSVAAYAGFLLMFLYSLQDVLPRMRSFAFSHHLGEISDLFENEPLERAIELANWRFGGATDYGGSLRDFSRLALDDINRSTSVIILGDARNNRGNPELDIMNSIYQRSKQVLWLNPEPRQAWGSGDSEMLRYQSACHVCAPCGNLQQLERVIDQLLKSAR